MLKPITSQLKRAGKLAGLGLLGGVAAKAGGYALRRASSGLDEFASEGDLEAGVVDALGGVILDGVGLAVYAQVAGGKDKMAKAQALAGPLVAGTLVVSFAPPVMAMVGTRIEELIDKLPFGGDVVTSTATAVPPAGRAPLRAMPGGLMGDGRNGGLPPAGVWSNGTDSGQPPAGNTISNGRTSGLVPVG